MKRFTILSVVILVSVSIVCGFVVYADVTAPLTLDKECVIVGRILGTDVMLYPIDQDSAAGRPIPGMVKIKGFEILNTTSGEWIPLTLSSEGYFCENVRMGEYELRGRDHRNRPYLIHRFNVPLNMAVNLGTFWLETSNPILVILEHWHNYESRINWREYRQGAGHIAVRVEHVTSREAYENCEKWFADCHRDAYEHFEHVMARR